MMNVRICWNISISNPMRNYLIFWYCPSTQYTIEMVSICFNSVYICVPNKTGNMDHHIHLYTQVNNQFIEFIH